MWIFFFENLILYLLKLVSTSVTGILIFPLKPNI